MAMVDRPPPRGGCALLYDERRATDVEACCEQFVRLRQQPQSSLRDEAKRLLVEKLRELYATPVHVADRDETEKHVALAEIVESLSMIYAAIDEGAREMDWRIADRRRQQDLAAKGLFRDTDVRRRQ